VLYETLMGLSWASIVAVTMILVVAGVVKGAIGVGLPLTAVPLLTQVIDLRAAVAAMTVPIILTNLTQAVEGGNPKRALLRHWRVALPLVIGTVTGATLLFRADRALIDMVVGAALIVIAIAMATITRLRIPPKAEPWLGPLVGLLAGALGGAAALFGPPLTFYLIGLNMTPDAFVKHISILFLIATVTLLATLGASQTLSWGDVAFSLSAMIPIQAGATIGRLMRRRISPNAFRLLILVVVAVSGLDLIHKGFVR
jgi:uncharacterized membrane protein YfcA